MAKLLNNDNNNTKLSGKILEEYKAKLSLSNFQREVIIGTLLGDACMGLREGKPLYSIKFEQTIFQEAYLLHLYDVFKPFVGTAPSIRNIKGVGILWKDRQSCWFRTYRHVSFKFYFDIFYSIDQEGKSVKHVPLILYKLITPCVLAYWFMDDGNKEKAGYILNTQSFTYKEHLFLQDILKRKFNLNASIRVDGKYNKLYLLSESSAEFVKLVSPYIIESFLYKL